MLLPAFVSMQRRIVDDLSRLIKAARKAIRQRDELQVQLAALQARAGDPEALECLRRAVGGAREAARRACYGLKLERERAEVGGGGAAAVAWVLLRPGCGWVIR